MKTKKKYTKPKMKVVKVQDQTPLLCGSCQDNPYWKDEQPSPEDWWHKN